MPDKQNDRQIAEKIGLVAIVIIIGVVIAVIIVPMINWKTQADKCSTWSDKIEMKRAELNGRENSAGGILDLDGSVAVMRNQFNLEIGKYNAECATSDDSGSDTPNTDTVDSSDQTATETTTTDNGFVKQDQETFTCADGTIMAAAPDCPENQN